MANHEKANDTRVDEEEAQSHESVRIQEHVVREVSLFLLLIGFVLLCSLGAVALALFVGPLVGVCAAIFFFALYLVIGPSPFPGLICGIFAMWVMIGNISAIALSLKLWIQGS